MSTTIDSHQFREVLGQYPTGVCVVTAAPGEGPAAGFVVGSFTSVSLDPPLVAFFPDKKSTSWPKIAPAGHFCVNILSADQEHLCRRFASKAEDKFAGVDTRAAPTGAPILDGVVAWIDCELESVADAGDHYIVLGRVRELQIETGALPLLFFQGGYGRFSPLSLAATTVRGTLTDELRELDLIRGEMESLATDLSSRCVATVVDGEDLIVLGNAGSPDAGARATLVGVHLPFAPSYGSAFAAWFDDERLDDFVGQVPAESRDEERRRITRVRDRGYSVGLINGAQREFASALSLLEQDPNARDQATLKPLVEQLHYDPVVLTDEDKSDIRVIAAPVFRAGGEVALALTVYGFPKPNGAVDEYVARLLEATQRASRLLGFEDDA
ncbi:flavin reductase [Nocardioides kongjuensis]|uniref:Flavin reductase (DIM6/NTAB) family NADH-FMN oxidoreductase RutF/DNA-binding IclR family transcriptional regulator n=1 Tax=Nocardioides kongjuensis TaxID=349522 RepID=A0A852RWU4_9ACTN|nr:flavin reductase [Nocardioides kongjuensis]NYD33340.1 flavin reductase (DIM6/NTAB) family NADH-FMN oxidoreductase RutF/DNA-binding IclR family transcriptional regulator [Nocardioides kongjuensis]